MEIIDQLHRTFKISENLNRIISLVPSQTEFLADCGLGERLVGVTKFCIHPKGLKEHKEIIGGTKNLRMDVIRSLKPDLIIANKEENRKEDIDLLEKEFSVWVSDIDDCNSALSMMSSLGRLLELNVESKIHSIREKLMVLKSKRKDLGSALYLIWNDPYMAAGNDTYINHMLDLVGLKNSVNENRYPELSSDEIFQLEPEYILLSSEPFPFSEKHQKVIQQKFPNSKVMIVDGEVFSWYGTRMEYAIDTLLDKFY